MSDADATDELNELFGSIGLSIKDITPEELFINEELTQVKIDTMRFWLRHEMARFHHMVKMGCVPCKKRLDSAKVPQFVPATALEYGTVCIDYYLDMKHLPWFTDLTNRKALNKSNMIKHILEIESVKKVIENAP